MKKILLALVALAAVGTAAPALGADLGARPYYNKAPAYAAPIYNWTGFYIGGHIGGAFSGSDNLERRSCSATTPPASSAACRPAPTGSSRRTGCSVSKASTAGSAMAASTRPSRAAIVYNNDQRGHRLDHRPHRLHLGSGPALREGRLRLFRQPRHPDPRRRADRPSRSMATTATATPSAPVSNTCSRRTGRSRASISTTTSAAPASWRPVALAAVRQLPPRRAHVEARRQLPLQLRQPGGRALLTPFNSELRKGRPVRRPFCFPDYGKSRPIQPKL